MDVLDSHKDPSHKDPSDLDNSTEQGAGGTQNGSVEERLLVEWDWDKGHSETGRKLP